MTAVLSIYPKFRAFTKTIPIAPMAGGKLYSYVAGTSTPLATYVDQAGVTPNTNPVVLDANGEADVWLGPASYKFILTDAAGVPQWTVDNITSVEKLLSDFYTTFTDATDPTHGDALIAVKQPLTGAVARTQHQKNLDFVTARDFGVVADGVTDDLNAVLAAINAVPVGGVVVLPDGNVNLGAGLVVPKACTLLLGAGTYTASANPVISVGATQGVRIIGKGCNPYTKPTNILAAAGSGYAISLAGKTGYDYSVLEEFAVTGNATADGGIYLQGEAKGWVTLRNLWIEDFTKSLSKGLGLFGAIAFIIQNVSVSGCHYGAYLAESNVITYTSSNLNKFLVCDLIANVMNVYIGGASHSNDFDTCNIAAATAAPAVWVEHGQGNTFRGCYFEGNAAGTCVIQVGVATTGVTSGHRTRCMNCYIVESAAITSFMHVYSGYQCGCFFCNKESGAGITNLVYYDDPSGQYGFVAFNGGNYPSVEAAGPRRSTGLVLGFDTDSDLHKNTSAIGRLDFETPFALKSCTVAQFGLGGIAPNVVNTMVYASNGRKAGEGAGAGTGVIAIYTNGAYRDPSQAYAVVTA